ncbi:MAG: pentapeptide repeat-containing protein [Leptolyngbyaceae bacterium]|nr:pentapeptide repeat-containing protein [Leptolyngbyaceae bacterium]
MRKRFKQWQPKITNKKRWVIGAIATSAFLGTVGCLWLLPDRRLQAVASRPSTHEETPLGHHHREPSISDIGAIATVAGGVLLLLNVRFGNRCSETANLSDADLSDADLSRAALNGAELSGASLCDANLRDADLSKADLIGADLSGADLSGANLSDANLSGANLVRANLHGANLHGAELRYTNFSGADLRYTNLREANFSNANLSNANLNCALLSDANFSNANLSGTLLFFINLRDVLNLEPLQLKAKPSPFLCNVALPSYSSHPEVNPNRDCDRLPQLLSTRYNISLKEAQGIVDEARQHRWH